MYWCFTILAHHDTVNRPGKLSANVRIVSSKATPAGIISQKSSEREPAAAVNSRADCLSALKQRLEKLPSIHSKDHSESLKMNRNLVIIAATAALASSFALAQTEQLETPEERLSYTIGMDIGQSLAGQDMPLDIDILMQGLRASYLGEETLLTQEEALAEREQFIQRRQQQLAEERGEEARINAEEGEAFLAANADKEGVMVTDSGLQYRVITEGEGASPDADDRVTVHYRGKLINGVEFDSSYARGEPATFGLNQVIPGWTEGVQLMKEGAKYEFFVPSELAYGEQGRPGPIGPNATLIFEVELLEVVANPAADSSD
tara:strand:- start:3013 stop:3969 length:957 start_codon:yes stop_codon:yes gene_type:complete